MHIVLGEGRILDAAQVIVYPAADPATHSVVVRVMLPDQTTEVQDLLLGPPLGAVAVHYLPRGQTLTVVATLYLAQFAWTLWELDGSAPMAMRAVIAVLVLNAAFIVMYAWGGRLHRN